MAILYESYATSPEKTVTAHPPAKKETKVSINVSPTSGPVPLPITVDGMLTTMIGAGVPSRKINLIINGKVVDTTTTTSEVSQIGPGYYKFGRTLTEAGSYAVKTQFLGDAEYEGCDKSTKTLAH